METTEERVRVVSAVYKKFTRMPIIGEVQIWMQHITFRMSDGFEYSEPLCKIVAGEKDTILWNNKWLKEEYRRLFPQEQICTDKARDRITPVIDIDEVSLFDVYKRL